MKPRILIVEDNESLREMFQQTLSARGFEVIVASTGAEALALSMGDAIDAVLTDLELPAVSGLDLCRAFAKKEAATGRIIPVWVMTGSDEPSVARQALAAGASGVLRKPFSLDVAYDWLRRSMRLESTSDGALADR